jgi:hypothetical protein
VVLMDRFRTPTVIEQIAAVQSARDYLARSGQWRAGRKGFDKARHQRELAALDEAVSTLCGVEAELERRKLAAITKLHRDAPQDPG